MTTPAVCDAHSGVMQANADLGRTVDEQRKDIRELQHRLPVWATLLLSFLTGCVGFLLGVITMLTKHS